MLRGILAMKKYQVDLLLMSQKGVNALLGCIKFIDRIDFRIYVGSDRAVVEDYSSQIIELCKKHDLKYKITNKYAPTRADFVVACAWRWLVDVDASRLVIFHDSLLPKYRGFSPLVNMLINGERELGVTVLEGAKAYDEGGIYLQRKIVIEYPIKVAVAIDMISALYRDLASEFLSDLFSDKLKATPQNCAEASYSVWRDEKDYSIDWSLSAEEICRFVDSVGYPYRGARAIVDKNCYLLVHSGKVYPDQKMEVRHCGKIIFFKDSCPVVICGHGLLKLVDFKYFTNNTHNNTLPFRTRFVNYERL
ncbi:formyltransferase family protein [Gammaproteobacteria bacterium]|nr:formyltransferase family protein [Gammaproteobacteria bacterium]